MGATASWTGLLLTGCLLALLLPFSVLGKSCHKVKLSVPSVIHTGSLVGKVNLKSCMHPNDVILGTQNADFIIEHVDSHYAIYSKKHITMPNHPLRLGIILLDKNCNKEKIIPVKLVTEGKAGKTRNVRELLRRTKRRWRPMPFSVHENYRGTYPHFVERIQSDTQQQYPDIRYSITGEGVDLPPIGLFSINEITGDIYINARIDREEYPSFQLMAYAKTVDGYAPESPLDLPINVEDDNDNAPIFTEQEFCAEVLEHSRAGAPVGRLNATDRDQPGTAHTLLRYYLIRQIPPSPIMFSIDSEYGIVSTTSNRLDRETLDHYTLIVEVRDMGGKIGYLSSTGTMAITVVDINDFAPSFVQDSYRVDVNENESGMVILRIPIVDNDMRETANWRAVYSIVKGNELGYFNMTTDSKTNEGLLHVLKGINYEEIKQFLLQVSVANEVKLTTVSGTKSSGVSTIPVTVIVKDVDEGPECHPAIKEIRTKENQTIGTSLGDFPATDPETKSSSGIRYRILTDQLSLVNINADTGRITTAKVLDYESKEIPNHTYNVTYLATDQSGKSGTCTLVIIIEDVSDNTPNIPRSELNFYYCQTDKRSVIITIQDDDAIPGNSNYIFALDLGRDPTAASRWNIVSQNGKSAQIEENGNSLPVGIYTILLKLIDQLGRIFPKDITVRKCNCADGRTCSDTRSSTNVSLGGLAILVMILSAILFAFLLCLLIACLCGSGAAKSKAGFPDDGALGNLLVNNTEAPGVDVMEGNIPTIITPASPVGRQPPGSHESGQSNGITQQTLTKTTMTEIIHVRTR
ncbi:desmocollin-3-like isoform X2 [Eleutherodactylus coqui]|uniref:desmocollin-3-like isoform X2 n=1 Tax=Eleutherodactylus coqui TaxID=57060 RepID=UPI003461FFAE